MHRMPWAVYSWPGLPQLSRGSWAGLVLAIGAALLLNAALVASLAWSDLMTRNLRIITWVSVGIVWSVAGGFSAWSDRRHGLRRTAAAAGDAFGEALDHYLRGDWYEAERVLNEVLRRNSRDLEARLTLATLLRHTKRFDEATRQLNILVRLDGAEKWDLEIRREGELLAEGREHGSCSQDTVPANQGET